MLEVRNDLVTDPVAEAAMADGLTPVLSAALAAIRNDQTEGASA